MARLALAMAFAFLAVNLALAVPLKWSRTTARPIDVQTRSILDARLDSFSGDASQGRPGAVFIGDSVVFGYNLRDEHGDRWYELTLPAQYGAMIDDEVLNLGINGVLFSDLECLARDALARDPELLVVNVSPRPFSADFGVGEDPYAREFLCDSPDLWTRLRGLIPLLRYRDVWQYRWLGSTPREFVVNAISARIQPTDPFEGEQDEDDIDLEDVLLKTRAANRLNSVELSDEHPQSVHLDRLLGTLASRPSSKVVLLYLEEDVESLGEQLDAVRYAGQQREFVRRLGSYAARTPNVTLLHARSSDFEGLYDDHVHLTAEGYRKLSNLLLKSTRSREADDAVD